MPTSTYYRRARGRKVTVDAEVLLDFIDASRELHAFINRDICAADSRPAENRMERWEIAYTTLCGSVEGNVAAT